MSTKKRNPQDLTLRNLRAEKRRLTVLRNDLFEHVRTLAVDVENLRVVCQGLDERVDQLEAQTLKVLPQ